MSVYRRRPRHHSTADNSDPHTGTITTVATETLLVGIIVNFAENSITPGSTGGTPSEAVDTPGTWMGYRAEASAGAKTMECSGGGTATVIKLVSIKETAGGGGGTLRRYSLALTGVG